MPDAMPVWLAVALLFALLVAPLYLMLRFLVRLARVAYGFEPERDAGPPLRICGACHNTVLERDFVHCPYCGTAMPDAGDPQPAGDGVDDTAREVGPSGDAPYNPPP
jgi:hypothetical protein